VKDESTVNQTHVRCEKPSKKSTTGSTDFIAIREEQGDDECDGVALVNIKMREEWHRERCGACCRCGEGAKLGERRLERARRAEC